MPIFLKIKDYCNYSDTKSPRHQEARRKDNLLNYAFQKNRIILWRKHFHGVLISLIGRNDFFVKLRGLMPLRQKSKPELLQIGFDKHKENIIIYQVNFFLFCDE